MPDPTANEPPDPASGQEQGDEEGRVPGDWQDVKRYLIGLMSLVMVAVVLMLAVAIYEYWHYAGAKAEDTTPIPASEDPMRQGYAPKPLHEVRGMEKGTPSASPSATASASPR